MVLGLPPTRTGPELASLPAHPDTALMTDIHVFADNGDRHILQVDCPGENYCVLHGLDGRRTRLPVEPLTDDTDTVRPVMHNGFFDMAQTRSDDGTVFGYGGWLDHRSFDVAYLRGTDYLATGGASVGVRTGSNPSPAGIKGSATWLGSMVGGATGARNGAMYQGGAGLEYYFDRQTLDVVFFRIVNLTTGAARANIRWDDLPVRGGQFRQSGAHKVRGSFYGPGHAEAGGVFDTQGIVGAFGVKRQPE